MIFFNNFARPPSIDSTVSVTLLTSYLFKKFLKWLVPSNFDKMVKLTI